jgi:HTH-type transcriptional regulator / antitoxin HigA
MPGLKYKIIKTQSQYDEYTRLFLQLSICRSKNKRNQDAIELLALLIKTWDIDRSIAEAADPIQLIHCLIVSNRLKRRELASHLSISRSYLSGMLHYRRPLTKGIIFKLATYFNVPPENFDRPYHMVKAQGTRVSYG